MKIQSCGNCAIFSDEDINGDGFCNIFDVILNCSDANECEEWKAE